MTSRNKIQLLSGPAVQESLENTAVRRVFRYRLNRATIGLLLLIGLFFFVAAAFLFFGPGLGGGYTIAFFIALFCGVSFSSMASFWGNFVQKRHICISDDFLFVGRESQLWRIHWSLVDRESLNLSELKNSRLRAKMTLSTGGQDIEIPLFTPFAFLDDIEGLIFELLQHLDTDDAGESATEASAPSSLN